MLLPGDEDLRIGNRDRWGCHVTFAAWRMSKMYWVYGARMSCVMGMYRAFVFLTLVIGIRLRYQALRVRKFKGRVIAWEGGGGESIRICWRSDHRETVV
jgi:hypothetical protein